MSFWFHFIKNYAILFLLDDSSGAERKENSPLMGWKKDIMKYLKWTETSRGGKRETLQ